MIIYHVTFTKRIRHILESGILVNQKQTWIKQFGKFKKGYVYAFTELSDACRWAFKQQYEFKSPVVIVSLDSDDRWVEDDHIEQKFGYTGKWLKSKFNIPTTAIKLVLTESVWMEVLKDNNSFK